LALEGGELRLVDFAEGAESGQEMMDAGEGFRSANGDEVAAIATDGRTADQVALGAEFMDELADEGLADAEDSGEVADAGGAAEPEAVELEVAVESRRVEHQSTGSHE
jgi:hypothetical protein